MEQKMLQFIRDNQILLSKSAIPNVRKKKKQLWTALAEQLRNDSFNVNDDQLLKK